MKQAKLAGIVAEVTRIVTIPVAVQVLPSFTSFGDTAKQPDAAGADALVLLNRFYQADIDIKTMKVTPQVALSTNHERLLRLRWLAILYGRVRPGLAITGGVSSPDDGIKAILAGTDVVQMVSALLRHGPTYLTTMRTGLERWMAWHKLDSLDDVRGTSSLQRAGHPVAVQRAHYIRTLQSWGH